MGDVLIEKEYITDWMGKHEVLEDGSLKLIEQSKEYKDKLLEIEEFEANFKEPPTPLELQVKAQEIQIAEVKAETNASFIELWNTILG